MGQGAPDRKGLLRRPGRGLRVTVLQPPISYIGLDTSRRLTPARRRDGDVRARNTYDGGGRWPLRRQALYGLALAGASGVSLLPAACGGSSNAKVAQVGTTSSVNCCCCITSP
jgi:hypothetical protein